MVPHVAERGHSFIGAGQYYLHDKGASTSERVAWVKTLNMLTEDGEEAMICMAVTSMHADAIRAKAGGSRKGREATKGDVYGMSLSFEKGAAVSDEEMLEAGLSALAAVGMTSHQAVLIRHTDTDHPHLHIIVNLVHPKTGIRAKLGNDRLKLSAWAEAYEREHGKIVCPQRVENNERRRNGEFVKHREEEAAQAPTINGLYQSADSGKAFAAAVQAELGLTLAMGHKGRVVLVDGEGKISALARQLEGQRAKDIKAKLADLDMKALPDAAALSEERQQLAAAKRREDEQAKQDALEREGVEPMQRQEDLQTAAEEEARAELAWQQSQAAEMEADRDHYEAKIREARELWREIVEPRQREEEELAASEHAAQEERSHRLAQVIDFAAERDRYEQKLREAKRQGQELVELRQPQAAAIALSGDVANDNRGHAVERGAVPDPTQRQLKSSGAKGRSLPGCWVIVTPSTAPYVWRARPCAGSRSAIGSVWQPSMPSAGGARSRSAGSGSGSGGMLAGCSASARSPATEETESESGSVRNGRGSKKGKRARGRSYSRGTRTCEGRGRERRRDGYSRRSSGRKLRWEKLRGQWRLRRSRRGAMAAEAMAEQDAAAPSQRRCRISRGAPAPDF
jgi:hypothetical protein